MSVSILILGLLLLVGGAELIVRGGVQLALVMRIPVIVVGLTIVALGTSAPELAVSTMAAVKGSTEMALSNVTGSNIANLALVVGLAAMVRPLTVNSALIRREVPACVGLQLAVPLLCLDGRLSRMDGVFLLSMGVLYNVLLLRAVSRQRSQPKEASEYDEPIRGHWSTHMGLTLIGLLLLVVGAHYFVQAATEIAELMGLSKRYIGLTVLALGTSAPEAVTAVVSSYRNNADLAIGASLGSNILNIALVLGVTALIAPIGLQ